MQLALARRVCGEEQQRQAQDATASTGAKGGGGGHGGGHGGDHGGGHGGGHGGKPAGSAATANGDDGSGDGKGGGASEPTAALVLHAALIARRRLLGHRGTSLGDGAPPGEAQLPPGDPQLPLGDAQLRFGLRMLGVEASAAHGEAARAAVATAMADGGVALGALCETVYCSPMLGAENADAVQAVASRVLQGSAHDLQRLASSTRTEAEERALLGEVLGLSDAAFVQADEKDGLQILELARRLAEVEA